MPIEHSKVTIDKLKAHSDPRGMVFEPLSADQIPMFRNVHVVVSEPGAIRGNHRHIQGAETTTLVGPSWVRFREDGMLRDVNVPPGEVWRFHFPPGVSHAFKNTGSSVALLASFNTVEHDPVNPDMVRDVLIDI